MNPLPAKPGPEIVLFDAEPVRAERADAQANRARILTVAQQLFAEKGVGNVSMAEIGREAGLGQGTLYRRFANKAAICQDLVDTQVREFQEQILQQLRRMNTAQDSYVAQLQWFLAADVRFQEEHLPMMRAILGDELVAPDHEPPSQWWLRRTIEGLLGAAQRDGELAPDVDLPYFVDVLLILLHPFTLHNQRTNYGFSQERIIAGLRHLVDALVQ